MLVGESNLRCSLLAVYGFEGEVKAKYNDTMFKLFSEVFDAIPIANVIDDTVLVVHGGLPSQANVTLGKLRDGLYPCLCQLTCCELARAV